ncbi:MAG: LCP family protein [Oscillospiraceae bacterium]
MSEHKKGGERLEKSSKPHKWDNQNLTKQQIIMKRVLIALVAVASVIIVAFIAYRLWAKAPDIPKVPVNTPVVGESDAPTGVGGDRKKGVYTFLLFGKDTGGGGNTDTMMLTTYDVTNQKIAVMSLPRDTMVNAPWNIKKLNAVYNFAPYYDKESTDYMKEFVGELVGYRPDFYVAVEWEAFGKLVEAVGGVEFDVPRDMNYEDPTQNLVIHQKKGLRRLNGNDAMQVVRYRHDNVINGQMAGYPNGDLGRIETQQGLLKALLKECLQIKNIATKYPDYLKIFNENVDTDLSMGNLAWFAEQMILGGFKSENLLFCSMPNNNAPWHGTSYVTPKTDELLALINESFNPYEEEVTSSEVDHMIVDDNGRLHASNGTVRDKNAGNSVNKPKPTPAPAVTPAPTPVVSEPVTSAPPTEAPPATESPLPADPPAESPLPSAAPDTDPLPTPPEGIPT